MYYSQSLRYTYGDWLLTTLTFAKPGWKLVEVEDKEEGEEEVPENGDEKDSDVKDDQDGSDYRLVTFRFFFN